MTNLSHVAETAFLMLVTYLLGCVIGYATRRILYAGRGTRTVTASPAQPAAVSPRRVMTSAARLAAAVSDEPDAPPIATPRQDPAAARPQRLAQPEPDQPKGLGPKPFTLSKPGPGGADDLKQIKGIGPKIEAALNGLGVYHIDQIAEWSKANIEWVEQHLAFKGRIARERWVEQAVEITGTSRKSA